jgi:peptide/nickel transport system permease protein
MEFHMPPFLQFVLRRFMVVPISLLIITMVLYGGVMLTPPEARAQLYFPERMNQNMSEEKLQQYTQVLIDRYHLDDPYLVQYGIWLKNLLRGDWGYSPSLNEYVLPALLRRTPITFELAFYSLLLLIPLGIISGVYAGWNRSGRFDRFFRGGAFAATSTPTFILALVFISVFYINLNWFAPGRISLEYSLNFIKDNFTAYTGLMTLDALLNGRFDVFIDSFRHLAMPVIVLSLYHWATLARVTRSTMILEKDKEYILSAKARGVSSHRVVWHHAFYNMLSPSLTSMTLSAAFIITGVFVVEIIFDFDGVSSVILDAMNGTPDAPAALGFAVYSVIMVLLLMFVLDVLQAVFDPRIREGVLKS